MNTPEIQEQIAELAAEIVGKPAKPAVNVGFFVVNAITTKVKERDERKDKLNNKFVICGNFISTILDNYVDRHFTHFISGFRCKTRRLKKIIEKRINLIITGPAGSGKSTALRWIFVHLNTKNFSSMIYFCAQMFEECMTIKDILNSISKTIYNRGKCVIFIDGLDELRCISGTKNELKIILDFFRETRVFQNNSPIEGKHTVVISTRPEHFHFETLIRKKEYNEKTTREKKLKLDDYTVYEIQPLSNEEKIKVCKTIKSLKKYEGTMAVSDHFTNKYPDNKTQKKELDERKYLKLLRDFVKGSLSSVLDTPIACRYAYQIVREWNYIKRNQNLEVISTLVQRIEFCLNAFIKWEYHDTHKQDSIEKYTLKVYSFLAEAAGNMDENGSLKRASWKLMKGRREYNASLCLLAENSQGDLSFEHKIFEEYFLARWYSSHSKNKNNDLFYSRLEEKLTKSYDFAKMYVELLFNKNKRLYKCITSNIVGSDDKNTNEAIEESANFAQGNIKLILKNTLVTVEEILKFFPCSEIVYGAIYFTKFRMKDLLVSGCLIIDDANYLIDCNLERITDSEINSICLAPNNRSLTKTITFEFIQYYNGLLNHLGGYYIQHEPDIQEILNRVLRENESLYDLLKSKRLFQVLKESKYLQTIIFLEWEKEEKEYRKIDRENIQKWIKLMIDFFNKSSNYWCHFDGNALTIYKNTQENALILSNAFKNGFQTKPYDYVSVYGQYKARMKSDINTFDSLENRNINDIDFSFTNSISDNSEQFLDFYSCYYSAWWKNQQLFDVKKESEEFNYDKLKKLYDLSILYETMRKIYLSTFNSKMQLMLSDEQLKTQFLMKDFESMIINAKNTIKLCQKEEYLLGEQIRNKIIVLGESNNLNRFENDLKTIFHRHNVWI